MTRPHSATVAAWLTWAICTVTLLAMVDRFAGKSPYFDDVAYFGMSLLPKNVTPADFWHPVNEHRVPLPKFTSWAVMRVFGYNPRLVMRVDIAFMAAGVAALMAAARSARGGTRAADSLFPLVLLSPGQAENFLWAVQVNFLLPAALAATAAALIAGCDEAPTARRVAAIGAVAALLALCGIQGQIPACALAAWLVWCGALGSGFARWVAFGGGLLALALALICFAAFERPANVPPPQWDHRSVFYTIRVIGSAWGPVCEAVGPSAPSRVPVLLGLVTVAVVAIAFTLIGLAARSRADRPAAAGLGLLLAATVATCAGVGFGRGTLNSWALAERYVTLAAPLVSLSYLAAVRFPRGRFSHQYAAVLVLVALALAWPNAEAGFATANARRDRQRLIEADARRGVPPSFFVDHHGTYVFPPDPREVAVVFEALRAMRVAPYVAIEPEPNLREAKADWKVFTTPPPGDEGWSEAPAQDVIRGVLLLNLPAGTRAIRIHYSAVGGASGAIASEVWWCNQGHNSVRDFFESGDAKSKRVWLGSDVVGRFEFRLEGPAHLRVERVVALVDGPPR